LTLGTGTVGGIHILQGERTMARDNKTLGMFRLDGIPLASRGIPQIEVTFDIDANSILHVTAKDKGTEKDQKTTITGASGLSDEEIEKLRKDAEKHAEEDKTQKEKIEVRNQLDQFIYQNEKQLKDLGGNLSDGKKKELENAIFDAKKVFDNQDASVAEVNSARENLISKFQSMAQEMYSQTTQQAQSSHDQGNSTADSSNVKNIENVVDADFEVVDDDKK
jgi:molecular chaperone DnaK